jgi:LPXTG-site transpeptidase (sortase) family protein
VTDPNRPSDYGRPRGPAGRGRALAIVAGVLLIVLASASLAFLLGGGLGEASRPASPPPAALATGSPAPGGSQPGGPAPATPGTSPGSTPGGASPGATDDPGTTAAPATPSDAPKTATKAKRIRIERLGIDQKIVEGDGIDAPIGKAAHFPGTGWPYGGTNIYIYGHARTGMFIKLWEARKGDEVVLDLVDGTSRTYVVTKVLPTVPWDAVQYLDPTPTEQLTLQTSTSYYATAPRFIVIAVPTS